MAQTIKIKRSATSGNKLTGSNSVAGEIGMNTADKALYIQTGSTDASVVTVYDDSTLHLDDTNNRVGIGTASPANSLEIATSEPIIRLRDTDTGARTILSASSGVGGFILNADAGNTVANSYMDFKVDNTTRMYINAAGRVGIGTSAPSQKLHVDGNIRVGDANDIIYTNILTALSNASLDITGNTGQNITFSTGSSERVRINSNGQLGIGVTDFTNALRSNGKQLIIGDCFVGTGAALVVDEFSRFAGPIYIHQDSSTDAANSTAIDNNGSRLVITGKNGDTANALDAPDGFYVSGQQIVTSARNLTNIGTITTSGNIVVNSNSALLAARKIAARDANGLAIATSDGTSRIDILNSGATRFNNAFTFPTSDGSPNQVLKTDGSGNVTWATEAAVSASTSISDADGDTKIQVEESADEDKIRFDTAGTERMIIDDQGRVGIGTSAPSQKLQVAGTILADTALTASSGTTGIGIGSESTIADNNSTYKVKLITENNNAKLTTYQYGSYLTLKAGVQGTGYSNNWSKIELRDGGGTGSNNAHMKFYTHGDERMVIDNYGKVGIGTTSPGRKLTVQGASGDNLPLRIIGGSGTNHGSMEFQDPNTTADYKVTIGSKTDDFYIQAGGTEKVRVLASGNVGIGSTSPEAKLHTVGHSRLDGAMLQKSNLSIASANISTSNEYISHNGPILTNGSTGNINQYGYFRGYQAVYGNDGTNGFNPYAQGAYSNPVFEFVSNNRGTISLPAGAAIRDGYLYQFVLGNSGSGGTNSGVELTSSNTTLLWGITSSNDAYFANNVGIGTDSPVSKLDVKIAEDTVANVLAGSYAASFTSTTSGNTGHATGILLSGSSGSNRGAAIVTEAQGAGNNHDLIFATSAGSSVPTERVRIDDTGRVGISTSTPNYLLDIESGSSALLRVHNTGSNVLTSLIAQNDLGTAKFSTQSGYSRIHSGSTLTYAANTTDSIFYSSGTEKMRLTSTGLTIGTATDTTTLEFPDKTGIPDSPTETNDKVQLIKMGQGGNGGMWQTTGRGGMLISSADDSLVLANGDVGRFYDPNGGGHQPNPAGETIALLSDFDIRFTTGLQDGWSGGSNYTPSTSVFDSAGNLGIGTTSPSQKLDVVGLIRSGGIAHPEIELVPTGSLGNADIRFDGTSLDIRSNSSGAYLTLQTATTERLKITNTGNFEFNNGNFTEVGTISSGNITTTGYLRGPSTFTIDPATHGDDTGTVVIAGNLQVDGTTTTINSTTLTVDDKNITLASGSTNAAAANGAGITVDCGSDTDATLTYLSSADQWKFNKELLVQESSFPQLKLADADDIMEIGYAGTNFFFKRNDNDGAIIFRRTDNSDVMSVDMSTMRVGIGIASPSYGLQVMNDQTSQSATGTMYVQASLNGSGKGLVIDSNTRTTADNSVAALQTITRANTTGLKVQVDGNVGIGTDNPVNNYASGITPESTKLAVVGANVSGYTEVAHFAAGNDSDNTGATVRIGHLSNDRGMFIKAGRGTSNQAKALLGVRNASNADSNILTLQEGGRVGIGTTSPNYTLDVVSTGGGINIGGTGAYLRWNSGDMQIKNEGSYKMGFYTYNSSDAALNRHMVIDTNGYVGIGTASPAVELDIKRHTNAYPLRIGSSQGEGRAIAFADVHASPNKYNWIAGTQYNIDNGFEITPSTAVGGYTFSNPALAILQTGNVGINQTSPAAKLQVEELGIDTTTTSTSATTQVAIDTFAAATFRSARYTIQVTNSTDSTYHITEILLIHDGTTPQITEYGTIFTGSAEATFDADISSGNVRLLATPATTDSMTFKVVRHCITV